MPSLRRRKADKPVDGSMPLMEHLHELRHRLFVSVLAIFLGAVAGFIWFSVGIPRLHIQPLGDILIAPYCAVPLDVRATFGSSEDCVLLATGAFSALQLRLTAAILAGVVLTCPVWLYQLWAFVGPALYSKEKRFAIGFTGAGAALFAGGMALAYLIIPEALSVLLGFGGDVIVAGLDPERYYRFLIGMMLIFGVSLELPLLLVMLNFAGVLKGAKMAQVRRYAYFGLVVFSGFAVPGNDPISMAVLAVTLCVLYEVATQVAKSHDKRKLKRENAAAALLDDTEASELDVDSDQAALAEQHAGDSVASPIGAPAAIASEDFPDGPGQNSGIWDDVT